MTERLLRRDREIVVAAIMALCVLAGLYTVFGIGMKMSALEMTAMSGMSNMPDPTAPGGWSISYAILVWLMWWMMMIAMMLPSVTPMVLLYSALIRRGAQAARVPAISSAFLGGYLAAWAGFSGFATVVQWRLEAAGLVSASMMTLIDTVPGAIVLIAAGAFQFMPAKRACLNHCRSPARFLAERRREGLDGAFLMGLEHGVYCLGCCWFLMALLFVGGVMNLYWIVGLAVLVAIEKLMPHGKMASRIAGAGLIVWGAVILLSTV
jgi:predicted metal-binding membrane protein